MKLVKKTASHTVYQRRDGRYAVRAANGPVNGEEKVRILIAEGLLSAPASKQPEAEAPAEEAPAAEASAEADAPAEDESNQA